MQDERLWSFECQSTARAVAVGLFCAFIPLPLQMVIAATMGVIVRANLVLCVALVWLTNPLTMLPVMYGSYRFGKWVLGNHSHVQGLSGKFSVEYIWENVHLIWQPLLLGCFLLGLIFALVGFALTICCWRIFQKKPL